MNWNLTFGLLMVGFSVFQLAQLAYTPEYTTGLIILLQSLIAGIYLGEAAHEKRNGELK